MPEEAGTLATQEYVAEHGGSLGYSVYTALITQEGTDEPTVTVLGTNTIGVIVWALSDPGIILGTLTGAFTENKTFFVPPTLNQAGFVNISRISANQIGIRTTDITDNPVQGYLTSASFEVRVYT